MRTYDEYIAHKLLSKYEEFYQNSDFTSSHFLFISPNELPVFEQMGYLIRESIQYHFFNQEYDDFERLLETFKRKKARQIRKERKFPNDLKISSFTGNNLEAHHALQMYEFYQSTLSIKGAIEYLNQEFFVQVFEKMKHNILYIQASEMDQPIAGALYFYDSDRLYGRYWGSLVDYPNLHFELCYYRGIEFCMKNKLSVFEAGAQGEHKISRGFKPVRTYSAHSLKHPAFRSSIEAFISEEKKLVRSTIERLNERLPFNS